MSVEFVNKIDKNKRFAKQGDNEYSVFSVHFKNPDDVEEWVRIVKPDRVLMDQHTYSTLNKKKIRWVFNKKNVLISCKIQATGGETKTSD